MSISANPLERVASTPILGALFNGLSITQGFGANAGNDNGASESEQYNLNPGARSLKERVLTLIDNNKPGTALDILQSKMASIPKEVEAIADDVLYELEEAGFEQDAKQFKSILAISELEPPKPKTSAEQAFDVWNFG
jgi:hypothetical protein